MRRIIGPIHPSIHPQVSWLAGWGTLSFVHALGRYSCVAQGPYKSSPSLPVSSGIELRRKQSTRCSLSLKRHSYGSWMEELEMRAGRVIVCAGVKRRWKCRTEMWRWTFFSFFLNFSTVFSPPSPQPRTQQQAVGFESSSVSEVLERKPSLTFSRRFLQQQSSHQYFTNSKAVTWKKSNVLNLTGTYVPGKCYFEVIL